MEVHHHAHTSRKKWSHYFWEFLMLFLAVFCGFIAENQREHYIEHQREKQFMTTLIHDLQNDTSNFARSIRVFQFNVDKFDSLKNSIKAPKSEQDILSIYKVSTLIQNFSSFNYSDRTIEQLRSAGNFRLVRKSKVSDRLIEYDRYIRHTYLALENILENNSIKLMDMQHELVDYDAYDYVNSIKWASWQSTTIDSLPFELKLVTTDEKKLAQYYNAFGAYRNWCKRMVTHSNIAKKDATKLIELIREEYHFN
ncbi:MAG TPA: hypothetical protein VFZ42_10110 [Chitinophagaceae bacterium]